MTIEPGFELHPLAAQDLTDIWEYIAEDNILAAQRVRENIWTQYASLCLFHTWGIAVLI